MLDERLVDAIVVCEYNIDKSIGNVLLMQRGQNESIAKTSLFHNFSGNAVPVAIEETINGKFYILLLTGS